jgi:hypothetical protein
MGSGAGGARSTRAAASQQAANQQHTQRPGEGQHSDDQSPSSASPPNGPRAGRQTRPAHVHRHHPFPIDEGVWPAAPAGSPDQPSL